VFNFFETVGLYVRKNALDKEIAHSNAFSLGESLLECWKGSLALREKSASPAFSSDDPNLSELLPGQYQNVSLQCFLACSADERPAILLATNVTIFIYEELVWNGGPHKIPHNSLRGSEPQSVSL
jgi:hypothetical protein